MKVVMDAVFNHTGKEFLHLKISWKREISLNIWTGILLMNFHLKVKGERFQTSNVLVIMVECQN